MKKLWKYSNEEKEFWWGVGVRLQLTVDCKWGNKGDLGGWVQKGKTSTGNARVSDNAWVYGNAEVYGNAQVSGNAQVYGNARVYGNAEVSDNAWVSGNAEVSGDAQVYGNAEVSDNAWVSGDAQVYGNARVYGNAWVSGDAQVYGNARVTKRVVNLIWKHWHVTITDTHMAIGCQNHAIKDWRNFDDATIGGMADGALEFWNNWKAPLLKMCDEMQESSDNE